MKRLLFLLFTLTTLVGYAQYPISSINITMPANPPANISNWGGVVPPVMITAQAQMRQGQVPGDVQESRILVTIKEGGSKKYGSFTPDNAPSAGFTTAVKTWSGGGVTNLLGNAVTLAPGTYELCVQFFSSNTPAKPLSNEVCKTFTVQGSKDEKYNPPVNIAPVDKKVFTEKEIKDPITFRWTPILPRPQVAVVYKLKVWQIMQGQTASQAIQSSQPIIEEEVKDQTQFMYRKGWDGKGNWIWRVEATDGQGKVLGVSEATGFSVAGQYIIGIDSLKIQCPQSSATGYTYNFSVRICNPNPGAAIFDKIELVTVNGSVLVSPINIISTFPAIGTTIPAGGCIWITGNFNYGSIISQACIKGYIKDQTYPTLSKAENFTCANVQPCNPIDCCKGSIWGKIKWAGFNNVSCGTILPQSLPGNSTQTISFEFNCNTNCSSLIRYDLIDGNLAVLSSTTGLSGQNVNFTVPSTAGVYCIVAVGLCDSLECSKCKICFKVYEEPNCCKGSSWNGVKWEGFNNVNCGGTIPKALIAGGTQLVNYVFYCNPKQCAINTASVQYVFKNTAGIFVGPIVNSTSGTPTLLTLPSIPGNYCLWTYGLCNGKICDSCKICFTVVPKTNCCAGSSWGKIDWKGFQNLNCGDKLSKKLKCNSNQQLAFNFNCDTTCTASIRYDLINSSGIVLSSTTALSGQTAGVTMPSAAGEYCIIAIGLCDSLECSKCKICFTVFCDLDCCKGSSWGNISWNGVHNVACGTSIPVQFVTGASQIVNYTFNCGAAPCIQTPAIIKYVFKTPSGVQVGPEIISASGVATTLTIPAAAGAYCLWAYAYCDGKLCDSCMVCISVLKPDCCKGSSWGTLKWNAGNVTCNSTLTYVLPINSVQTLNYTYNCNPQTNCTAKINYVLTTSTGTVISSVIANSGVNQNITMPNKGGNYCIVAYGICNGDTCQSCKVCFTVTCENCKQVSISAPVPVVSAGVCSLNGTITGGLPITKVTAQLVSFSADKNILTIPAPVPNFEFLSTSNINGPVSAPFSLTGLRSNILISTFASSSTSLLFSLKIDNMNGKTVKSYRIKFTLFFADGSYCEREIIKSF